MCKLKFFFSLNIQIYGFFVITVAITLAPSVAEKTGDEVILTSCGRDNWSDRSDGFANFKRKEKKNVKMKKNIFKLTPVSLQWPWLFKLTIAVAPFPVSIVVRCQGAPKAFTVSSCAAVVTAAFVDERECTAVT